MNNGYFQTPPVVKNLIVINILVYLATSLLPVGDAMIRYGALFNIESPLFHSYQVISYMFLHGNLEHLFFNMFALWMFGRTLEYELNSKRFVTYFMVCGVGAALLQLGIGWLEFNSLVAKGATFAAQSQLFTPTVGASGAVFGLLLAFGVLHPNAEIFLMFIPIPIKAKWFVIGYGVIELLLGWRGMDNIAHFAHLGGMLWGLGLLLYWKRRGIIRF